MADQKNYRPNAAVILTDGLGHILICESLERKGVFQVVQGGIDEGESPEDAARREITEELGITSDDYEIIEHMLETYAYDWDPEDKRRLKATGFVGQNQYFFLAKVRPGVKFNLEHHAQEFSRVFWGTPEELLRRAHHTKVRGLTAALEAFKRKW